MGSSKKGHSFINELGMDHMFQVDVSHIELGVAYQPLADFFESEASYQINLELPGVAREDINIEILERTVTVEGVKRNPGEDSSGDGSYYHMMSRIFGKFRRRFELPAAFDANGAHAKFDQGILTVVFPKVIDKRRRKIVVQIE